MIREVDKWHRTSLSARCRREAGFEDVRARSLTVGGREDERMLRAGGGDRKSCLEHSKVQEYRCRYRYSGKRATAVPESLCKEIIGPAYYSTT